jgi:hypothetical protein
LRKWIYISLFLLLIALAWIFKTNLYRWWRGGELQLSECSYKSSCLKIKNSRADFLSSYKKGNKKEALNKASKAITKGLYSNMFQCWYGTGWSFNGTSQTPQQGTIACGYFVTTLLRDAGVPLNRVKLAQCGSEEMIRSLVKPSFIYNYNGVSMNNFRKAILKKGEGIYIIGLDNHTGFIACIENEVWFVHSSGAFPFCVIKEKVLESSILKKSSYKLCGAISKDPDFLLRWMKS